MEKSLSRAQGRAEGSRLAGMLLACAIAGAGNGQAAPGNEALDPIAKGGPARFVIVPNEGETVDVQVGESV